jgi:cyclophilin family peptidyl-prolyl cis-trans isomerase
MLFLLVVVAVSVSSCQGGSDGAAAPGSSAGSELADSGGRGGATEASDEGTGAKDEGPDPVAEMPAFIAGQSIDRSDPKWKTSLPRPPQVRFDEDRDYFWTLETNVGDIKIRFLPKVAPMHVSSTLYLTELGFYDGVKFHRVIPGFMAQGGDPLGTGRGGPGYKYEGEFDSSVRHDRPGLLSMANAGAGTDGSQFFITFVPTPHLDGQHTIFGEVVQGMDTLKKLEAEGSRAGKTRSDLFIEKATFSVN